MILHINIMNLFQKVSLPDYQTFKVIKEINFKQQMWCQNASISYLLAVFETQNMSN